MYEMDVKKLKTRITSACQRNVILLNSGERVLNGRDTRALRMGENEDRMQMIGWWMK